MITILATARDARASSPTSLELGRFTVIPGTPDGDGGVVDVRVDDRSVLHVTGLVLEVGKWMSQKEEEVRVHAHIPVHQQNL